MIKSKKGLLSKVSKIGQLENEAEKATRRFFGTFVSDIKRHWTDLSTNKIKKNTHHNHVSQLTSAI